MIEEGLLPQTTSQLKVRLADYRPQLEVSEQGRQALQFLRWPNLGPVVRAAYIPVLAGAVATLDPEQCRLLGIGFTQMASSVLAAQTRGSLILFRVLFGASPSLQAAKQRAALTLPTADD
jgi:hypothetical protein